MRAEDMVPKSCPCQQKLAEREREGQAWVRVVRGQRVCQEVGESPGPWQLGLGRRDCGVCQPHAPALLQGQGDPTLLL